MREKAENMVAVIMAGGTGTRFWPLSTGERPKQFLRLFGDRSLLQESFDRISGLLPPEKILVLTNAAFVGIVREQLPELPDENIIGEPVKRDTAAAVCLAALLCRKRFGNPVIVILTADHLVEPVRAFRRAIVSAANVAAREDVLYTFGIRPAYPATVFGYLEFGRETIKDKGVRHFELLKFKEKPDPATAASYLESARFYWNSGMFVWTADAILKQIKKHLSGHFKLISRAVRFDRTTRWAAALDEAFSALVPVSIDYAVMEKARNLRGVAANFSWNDVGSWMALEQSLPRDASGNSFRGEIHVLDSERNLVFCEDPGEMVALIGVEDFVIVRAGRKTLIMKKDKADIIKDLVQYLEKKKK
jgi:mannose-1-phosphate guanylyltransferase